MDKRVGSVAGMLAITLVLVTGCGMPAETTTPQPVDQMVDQQPDTSSVDSPTEPIPSGMIDSNDGVDEPPSGDAPGEPPLPTVSGNPTAGAKLFRTPQVTNFGISIACMDCHGQDGEGATAVALFGVTAATLVDVTQGNASHPAPTGRQNVQFPELTPQEFLDIAAFLAQ